MEPRRIALAVVLMAAVLILTPYIFPPPKTAPGANSGAKAALVDSLGQSVAQSLSDSLTRLAATDSTAANSAPDSLLQAQLATPAIATDTTVIETAVANYRTSNLGASIIGAQMSKYQALSNGGRTKTGPVELARKGDQLLTFRLVAPGDTVALDRTVFQTTSSKRGDTTVVQYETQLKALAGAARNVSITYSFLPDSYRVSVSATVTGMPDSSWLLIELPKGFQNSEADSVDDSRHLSYAYKQEVRGAKGVAFRSLDPGEQRIEPGPLTWAIAKNKYFILGVLAPKGSAGFAEADFIGGNRTGKVALEGNAMLVAPVRGGNGTVSFDVYAGPQEFKRLVAMGREFESSNPYGGWFQGMVQPFAAMIIRLLLWMKTALGLSYGWILVIFGVAVRVILWPLNQKAMKSQIAMQRISPEMQEIQKRYKGDPQKLQAAMMQLYKEHGMSPFSSVSGCLPMLIPMPIFFALFFVFQNTIEFRGVPFMWLPDISVKDPYFILPIFVAITSFLISWMGMRGSKVGEQQKIMMYAMPAMMLFFFFSLASGLNLYYLIQNIASLPQQWLIANHRNAAAKTVVRG